MIKYNGNHKQLARELRNNMTEEEIILWSKLKHKQLKDAQFYRQKPIGNYIADFYCAKYNLVIELDGSQHFTEDGKEYDECRDNYMEACGLKVLRFTNYQIKRELYLVLDAIYNEMKD